MKKIIVFPKDSNPYQSLLYNSMKNEVLVKYLDDLTSSKAVNIFLYPIVIACRRLLGFKIFHVHWLWGFIIPIKGDLGRLITTIYTLFIFLLLKSLNYKIVWTVHNLIPHERITINDRFITKLLYKLSNALIVHSKHTLSQLKDMDVQMDKIHVIPIGNYNGIYKNDISKEKARKLLRIPNDYFVFSYFGLIRKYKGVDNLLESFIKIADNYKDIVLLIAGKCDDPELKKIINKAKELYPKRIITKLEFIPDDEVQLYFNAADIMVFPFKRITTSSSIMLSASFGKSIICPAIGNLTDLPSNIGITYDPNKSDGISKSLIKALHINDQLSRLDQNTLRYGRRSTWKLNAVTTLKIYKSILKKN